MRQTRGGESVREAYLRLASLHRSGILPSSCKPLFELIACQWAKGAKKKTLVACFEKRV